MEASQAIKLILRALQRRSANALLDGSSVISFVSMPTEFPTALRVLLFHEHAPDGQHFWVAQCVDFAICAQGETLEEVKTAFETTWDLEVKAAIERGYDSLEHLPAAPERYRELWDRAWQMENRLENHAPPTTHRVPRLGDAHVRIADVA